MGFGMSDQELQTFILKLFSINPLSASVALI